MQAGLDLSRIGSFKEEFQRLDQILAGLFNAVSLAGNIQFGAESHIARAFPFNNASELIVLFLYYILPDWDKSPKLPRPV
jgi:CelD/BcsL family acetyltransferase involved in cellulose biosynthesis